MNEEQWIEQRWYLARLRYPESFTEGAKTADRKRAYQRVWDRTYRAIKRGELTQQCTEDEFWRWAFGAYPKVFPITSVEIPPHVDKEIYSVPSFGETVWMNLGRDPEKLKAWISDLTRENLICKRERELLIRKVQILEADNLHLHEMVRRERTNKARAAGGTKGARKRWSSTKPSTPKG